MKIRLNTNAHIDGTEAMASQVSATVEQALDLFSEFAPPAVVGDAPRTALMAAATERDRARMLALSRWENEGGAGLASISVDASFHSDTEAEQLRIRVVALENLVIALLADATDDQRSLAIDMADFISPRPGYTPHPLTLRAADAMRSLRERADRFRPAKHT